MPIKSYSQLLALIILLLLLALTAAAQSRDHLTPKEVELVQEAQVLDQRIGVFDKAMERRMQLISGAQPAQASHSTKPSKDAEKKDAERWGELPTGTRAQLIDDIARILEEAITNIDDVSMHDEKNPLLARALRQLAAAATQVANQLTPLREQAKSPEELSSIEQALENAQSIADAAKKLPPPSEAEKNKGKPKKPKG
jgi:acyl-CoA reductase-like NAD-dependent aldehyde dehydrogenase